MLTLRTLVARTAIALAVAAVPMLASSARAAQTIEPAAVSALDHSFARAEAAAKAAPRQTFDPQAVLEVAGRDPAALTDWVRKNTVYVPYRGALRGPAGVLMDGSGNALDRAWLLAELVQSSGFTVRLAHASIEDAAAQAIIITAKPPAPSVIKKIDDAAIADLAKANQLDPAALKAQLEKGRATYDAAAQQIKQRTESQAASVLAAASKFRQSGDDEAAIALAAAKDHWWVQVQDGDKWNDFDPTRPAGAAALSAANTVELPQSGDPKFADGDQHTVRIRLLAEKDDAGKRTEQAVLDQTFKPSELAGGGLTIIQTPIKGPGDVDLDKEKDPAGAMAKAFRAQSQWLPVIINGANQTAGQAFDDGGNIVVNPKLDKTGGLGGGAAASFGGFGGLGGGDDAKPGVLSAETIEYTVHTPGSSDVVIRRPLFDVIGPAARAAGSKEALKLNDDQRLNRALIVDARIDILPLGGNLRPEFVSSVLNDDAQAIRKPLLESADKGDFRPALSQLSAPTVLYSTQLLRQAMAPRPTRTFIAQTNILASYRALTIKPDGKVGVRQMIDLSSNPIGVRAGEGEDAFTVRVYQGVADTAAERAALGGSDDAIENTAELFARGGDLEIVATGNGLNQTEKLLPPDVQARIQKDLGAGNVVVAPTRPVKGSAGERFGWYRVDPKTGQTVGVNDNGLNGATIEDLIIRAMGRLQQACGVNVICSCSSLWAAQTAEEFAANMGIEFGAMSWEMQIVVSQLHAQMQAYIQRCMELHMY